LILPLAPTAPAAIIPAKEKTQLKTICKRLFNSNCYYHR
jgi:hypothetical protein